MNYKFKKSLHLTALFSICVSSANGGKVTPFPSNSMVLAVNEPINFVATPDHGSVETSLMVVPTEGSVVSDTIASFTEPGKVYTCIFTVDHKGSSPDEQCEKKSFTYTVYVPKLTLTKQSSTPGMTDGAIPTNTAEQASTNNEMTLMATVEPPDTPGINVDFIVKSASPDNSNRGGLPETESAPGELGEPGAYSVNYRARTESASNKCVTDDALKSQAVVIEGELKAGSNSISKKLIGVIVRPKYEYLLQQSMKEEALEYLNLKYSLGGGLSYGGAGSGGRYAETGTISGQTTFFDAGLDGGEQWAHSIAIHEKVHVAQGYAKRAGASLDYVAWMASGGGILYPGPGSPGGSTIGFGCMFSMVEIEAWQKQIDTASECCLNASQIETINEQIEFYQDILDQTYCADTGEGGGEGGGDSGW